MDYEKYLGITKNYIKKMTLGQRLIVAIVFVIVAAVAIYLINPSKKFLEMRNSQRRSDVVNILNAVYQYGNDHGDKLNALLPVSPAMICRSNASSCEGKVDITQILTVEKKLLSKTPVDSRENDPDSAGYQISRLANGRISVSAPLAENGTVISLSK